MRTVYSARVWAGFEVVFRPWMRRRLDGVHLRGVSDAGLIRDMPRLPVLLMANHVSWWDGFLLREVHRALRPDAPLHVVMLEEELRRVPIFRWMGAVPLARSSMGARDLLRDLRRRVERRPNAVVGYFPQGRIWPSHRRPLGFRRGAGWLASRLAPVIVVPVGLHLEPLTRPGPAAFISVGRPRVVRSGIDSARIEALVTAQVDAILACTRQFGEEAVTAFGEDAATAFGEVEAPADPVAADRDAADRDAADRDASPSFARGLAGGSVRAGGGS